MKKILITGGTGNLGKQVVDPAVAGVCASNNFEPMLYKYNFLYT